MVNAEEIIELIIKSNSERNRDERIKLIDLLLLKIEMTTIQLRIANELRLLGGQTSYLYLVKYCVDLSKQAEGWKKYTPQNG